MKKSIVALGIVLALSGCAAAADETLAAEPAALVEISPTTEETAQPVLSARPAAYAAIGRTVLPTMSTSPTPALRAWVWPVGFAPPPRGSIPTGLSHSTKTPTCFHTQIMI